MNLDKNVSVLVSNSNANICKKMVRIKQSSFLPSSMGSVLITPFK